MQYIEYISIILLFLLVIMTIMYFLKNPESNTILNKKSCEKIGLGKPKEYVDPSNYLNWINPTTSCTSTSTVCKPKEYVNPSNYSNWVNPTTSCTGTSTVCKPKEYVDPNIFPSYIIQNFVKLGYLPSEGNIEIINGTLDQCKARCNSNSSCVGFSREKNKQDTDIGDCFLKSNLIGASLGNLAYQTYQKRTSFV